MNRDLPDYLSNFSQLPFERIQEKFRKRKILDLINQHQADAGIVLEVGPGINPLFPFLDVFEHAIVLEPIYQIFDWLKNSQYQKSNVQILNSNLEKFIFDNIEKRFDTIFLSSVLHEISYPEIILKTIYNSMQVGGRIFVVVPNNQSVHRLIGEKIGIISSLSELTKTERKMQQFSSYSPKALASQLEAVGFRSIEIVTQFIKPLPHAQMQEAIDNSMFSEDNLEFLYKLSDLIPDFGSEIFGVAVK